MSQTDTGDPQSVTPFNKTMGQLEAYSINETMLTGLMITTFATQVSETIESVTFESFKAYVYSSNITSLKGRKLDAVNLEIVTPDRAIFRSWSLFDFTARHTISMTKILDDFQIWQDMTSTDFKVDENVIKLQRRYNFE
jgi:hypothetical protein